MGVVVIVIGRRGEKHNTVRARGGGGGPRSEDKEGVGEPGGRQSGLQDQGRIQALVLVFSSVLK